MSTMFYMMTRTLKTVYPFQLTKYSIKFWTESFFGKSFFLFSKLINAAVPGKVPPISPEAINLHPSTTYHKIQNLNLGISSAKSIGCTVINVRPEFIMEKREHIVLGLIWQIIRVTNSIIFRFICLIKLPLKDILKLLS